MENFYCLNRFYTHAMHKTTIFIIELCFVDESVHLKGVTSVKVICETAMSQCVLNEGVTTARTCSFVETCTVCKSGHQKIMQWKVQHFIMEICPGWLVEGWPSWQRICWGTVEGIAKWTFSRVVIFLTIMELWHHILSYSMWEVPNFVTVNWTREAHGTIAVCLIYGSNSKFYTNVYTYGC